MKRWLLILNCLIALLLPVHSFAVDDFDLTYVRDSDNYTIEVDQKNDVAFVECVLDTAARSFHHKYENDFLYSSTQWDMIVINYFETNSYPVLRLWINYTADDYLNINAVSFDIEGKRYTFSGISSSDRIKSVTNGISESLLIRFGNENTDFLVALLGYILDREDILKDSSRWSELQIPMKLYGAETVDVTLGVNFVADAFGMLNAWLNSNGATYLSKVFAEPMKVTVIQN